MKEQRIWAGDAAQEAPRFQCVTAMNAPQLATQAEHTIYCSLWHSNRDQLASCVPMQQLMQRPVSLY